MDLGNVPRTQRDQVGSSKEAKNRDSGTEKLLELALFISVGETRTLRLKITYFLHLMSLHFGDGRMW